MKRLNTKIVLIIIVSLVGVIAITLLIISARNSRPDRADEYTDPDTGEVVVDTPNRSRESYNSDSKIIVLGMPQLQAQGVTSYQAILVRNALEDYSSKNAIPDTIVKILEPELRVGEKKVTATLLHDSSKKRYRIEVLLDGHYAVVVTIYNEQGSKVYDSGPLDSRERNQPTNDSGDYTGDGVPPELQP